MNWLLSLSPYRRCHAKYLALYFSIILFKAPMSTVDASDTSTLPPSDVDLVASDTEVEDVHSDSSLDLSTQVCI